MIKLLFLLFPVFLVAGNDTINFKLIDQKKMNLLILKEISIAKGVEQLNFDTSLFKAAEFHALYLSKNDTCGHFETDFPLAIDNKTRINYFISRYDNNSLKQGKDNNIVESSEICCAFSTKENITYSELVKRVISQFENSPNHWKIIKKPMGEKVFFNAASVVVKPNKYGFRVTVVIVLNYYNKKYSENPSSILKTTKDIQNGEWDHLKKDQLFNSSNYQKFIIEYNKRKKQAF